MVADSLPAAAVENPAASPESLPPPAPAAPRIPSATATIVNLMNAGRPLIYIQSSEEDRVERVLQGIAASWRGGVDLLMWSMTDGLQRNGQPLEATPQSPRTVLDFILHYDKPAIFLLKDFHASIEQSPEIRRRLRDLYFRCAHAGKFIVLSSPLKCIPEEISREIAFTELPRPDIKEIEELVQAEAGSLPGSTPAQLSPEMLYILARALQGLSSHEVRHALQRTISEHGKLDAGVVRALETEKQQLVRKSGLVEYVPNTTGVEQIGGLDVLKYWLTQRRGLFMSRDSLSAEIVPKGLLLMGISGCGKSLSARAVASAFDLPLYRIDMVQVFSNGIGNAERLFASACRTMEEVSPAVAWFDEIEAGISREHQDDNGVLDRIFGFFLTFMQEKTPGLFVVATANRIDLLPAEMIRKGRFDQVFFIDLPDRDERLDILKIHLAKRGLDATGLDLGAIADRTEGWTGAELEQAVVAALIAARLGKEPIGNKHLYSAIRQFVPLSRTMKEQVSHIRSWAFDRAIRASSRRVET